MNFLNNARKYFERKKEEVTIHRIDYSEDGNLAEVYYSNGNSCRVRTEKALREIGVFNQLSFHHENH